MTAHHSVKLLDGIDAPADLRRLEEGQLAQVAEEVRQTVIEAVSQTGGHLGAGLGVCELTVALHYLFDTPKDKLVWDVSHQCYPHKTLTGRKDRLTTLRQGGGLSGFTSREESEYDPFGAAHSSTAISAAVGFAQARDFRGEDGHVIAVVGDGAMTAGMAYEGLNNAGYLKTRMIVILNDNNMSIAPPAGALSDYLTRLRKTLPETDERRQALEKAALKSFVNDTTMFEDLGVKYVGPIDGHDMGELLATLKAAKEYEEGPILIHCLTRKGKGYAPAEASADCYHGVVKFDVDSGKQHKPAPAAPAYTKVFAKALIDAAKTDDTICAVSAAMPGGTGLDLFGKEFPDRTFDVGIAEQHAVTFCGGLAAEGFKPFAAIYSTFLQRGYDQVVHDIAIQKLPVRFAIDRAGMVGADGVTHQGSYDIAYLGCLPNFVLMAPGDEAELVHMVATACAIDDRPSALRYPRGEGLGLELPAEGVPLEIGKGRIMREGTKVAILSYGSRLGDSLLAAEELDAKGIPTTVADARFAKPIDTDLVTRLAREHEVLITVEEASIGGFAAQVTHHLTHTGLLDGALKFRPMYLPDRFIDHGKPQAQIEQAGLAAPDIVAMAVRALGFEAATPMAATGE